MATDAPQTQAAVVAVVVIVVVVLLVRAHWLVQLMSVLLLPLLLLLVFPYRPSASHTWLSRSFTSGHCSNPYFNLILSRQDQVGSKDSSK